MNLMAVSCVIVVPLSCVSLLLNQFFSPCNLFFLILSDRVSEIGLLLCSSLFIVSLSKPTAACNIQLFKLKRLPQERHYCRHLLK